MYFRLVLITLSFFCTYLALQAQQVPGLVYTRSGDTLVGMIRFKNQLDLQNHGLTLTDRKHQEKVLSPDGIQLAYLYLTAFDTLKLLPVPKSLVQKHVDVEGLDSTKNKYLLIQTDLGAGPLQLQTVCSGITVTKHAGTFINGFYQPGLSTQKAVTKEFIAKDHQWTRLPENRFDRRDILVGLLADCPTLTDQLKKDKINPLKKMKKILSLYNHCHLK